ncbi:hypothetical protein LRP30_29520 [Bradyrhizobium sp. C-145]|uniref:DUF6894 family protein n=1 Tax=Bradyrhizobium sp. C-145 TaxID=574727 RepID=UPI00201B5099|nr:hypothetical protein [Bradyrhizobium sp. C-145]UQR61090.1 hypothetical protein LRP30_29520 [Bradyrhizobium sp. C-145]
MHHLRQTPPPQRSHRYGGSSVFVFPPALLGKMRGAQEEDANECAGDGRRIRNATPACLGLLAPHPNQLLLERCGRSRTGEQHSERQGARQTAPQESHAQDLDVSPAHPTAGINCEQHREHQSREGEVPLDVGPTSKQNRVENEYGRERQYKVIPDIIFAQVGPGRDAPKSVLALLALRTSSSAGKSSEMPLYFFDFHDAGGVTVENVGVELPGLDAARGEAQQTIGEAGRALMAKGADGRSMVQVRDEGGPLMTVTATFVTTFN